MKKLFLSLLLSAFLATNSFAADQEVYELDAATPESTDLIYISDTGSSNTSKKVTFGNFFAAMGMTGMSDVGSATQTSGNLLVSDGTNFQSVDMAGDCTITNDGQIECTEADALESNPTDCTNEFAYQIDASGNLTCKTVEAAELASTTVTAGSYQAPTITVDADGRLTYAASGGLTGLSDVGSATQGAGRLIVSDGSSFQSLAISGDVSVTGAGVVTLDANTVDDNELVATEVAAGTYQSPSLTVDAFGRLTYAASGGLTGLSDVGSATQGSGKILISDGSNFQSLTVSGDIAVTNAGVTAIQADSVALTTDTTGNYVATLADAGNSTITVANGSAEGGAATVDAVDLNCSDCLNATEIEDIYLLDDGDVGTGVFDFGGADSFELPQSATPTTNATGEIALDTTITDHQPLFQYYDGDENMTIIALPTANLGSTDDYIIKYDAASDDFQFEADAGAAGGDSIEIDSVAVVDPDFVSTGDIDFVDTSNTVTANINAGAVDADELASTSVAAGTYQAPTITVDADGRLTYAASGGLTGLSDVGSATQGAGRIIISDGGNFDSAELVLGDADGADGDSANTDSDSGLEWINNELTMIRGCDDNQILKWDETNDDWNCEADADSGGAPEGTAVLSTGETNDKYLRADGDNTSSWQTVAGGSSAWDDLTAPDADLRFAKAGYQTTFDGTWDGQAAMTFNDSDSSLSLDTTFIVLRHAADGDEQGIFIHALDNNADTKFKVGQDGDTTIGDGSSGAIDFGTNTINDTIAGHLQKDWMMFRPETAKISGDFVTTGAGIEGGEATFGLAFDSSTDEQGVWSFRTPFSYGSAPTIKMSYTTAATSGTIGMETELMCVTDGDSASVESASFDTANDVTGGTTVPGTAEYLDEISVSLSSNDSMAAGDFCILRINRDVDDDDTAAADVHLKAIQLEWLRNE